MKAFFFIIMFSLALHCTNAQISNENTKGKLFIIGGGKRSETILKTMIATARLNSKD